MRSARHKAPLIYDVIHDNCLDVLCMTETWIPSDTPNAVKLDVTPPEYAVIHRHLGSSKDRGGGGVASVDVGDYSEFECLAVKLVGRPARSVIVVCIYRPPAPVSTSCADQLLSLIHI